MTLDAEILARKLAARVELRKQLAPITAVMLAYARAHGMTQEVGRDRAADLNELNRQLDALDPDAYAGIAHVAEQLGDRIAQGIVRYSSARGLEQHLDAREALLADDDRFPTPEDLNAEAEPAPHPTRRR